MMKTIALLLAAAASLPTAAHAQDAPAPPTAAATPVDLGADRITVGVAAAVTPGYTGSDDYSIVPGIAVQGQVSGISFETAGTALYVDAIRGHGGVGWKVQLGPLANLRLDRHTLIGDPQVEALGKLKPAYELGVWGGVQRTGVVTSPYDTLSIGVSWQGDVGDAHRSFLATPSVSYSTPLSRHAYVSLSGGADYVGRRFGDYYYDITPGGAAASGLAVYDGADRAGWKDWNLSLLAARSLTGDLTHGFTLFATGGYQRVLGRYARSPIVAEVGDPNQWSGAIGVAYTF
jgi:outer membrane scaffolding protein for murein synthesis (MipA/OmpV family)